MAPSQPLRSPVGQWTKYAIYLQPLPQLTFLHGLLDNYVEIQGAGESGMDEWRKAVWHFEDTISDDKADDCFISFEHVNITSGVVDNSWTDADYASVENSIDATWPLVSAHIVTRFKLSEILWYRRAFNPYPTTEDPTDPNRKPFADSGPPVRITPMAHLGAGITPTAPQVSLCVSERTPWPKHHGRFYPPGIDSNVFAGTGRVTTAVVDSWANAWGGFIASTQSAELPAVVACTQLGGKPFRALVSINHVSVDDSPDVIRRRHFEQATYEKVLPSTP